MSGPCDKKIHDVGAPDGEILPVNLPPEAMAVLQRVHHLVMKLDPKTVEEQQALIEIQEILRRHGFSNG